MDKAKEIASDPAKLDAKLKEDWAKLDTKGEGFVSYKVLMEAWQNMAKSLNLPADKAPSQKDDENIRKVIDPEGTGKVTFEGFARLVKSGIEKHKASGQA